jgi:hypothetical protein
MFAEAVFLFVLVDSPPPAVLIFATTRRFDVSIACVAGDLKFLCVYVL